MSNPLTLGVIGHVDHGKTALVRALTGIETDRLKEERERGLSIVLGFAYLETVRGTVDLIDVPGHEDFVRAMISGATALDGIVLCIAANEGVMPQTREHFNIARLLGVDKGLIAITKTDLVDAEGVDLALAEVGELVRGTFLESAPVVCVSAESGAGVDALRASVEELTRSRVEREQRGRFFLPLDRVFTMRGFGLVVTGTLRGANLTVGETVEIMPARRTATIRALQNHNQSINEAAPGQRVAVNLRQVERSEIRRGDVLASPGLVTPTRRVDIELRLLDDVSTPLKSGAVVRFLTGTTEAIAKLRLLDRRELAPGDVTMAQANLDREIASLPAEHFLVRSYSPMHTIAGGTILGINAARHRRYDTAVTERLATVASGDRVRIVAERIASAGVQGVSIDRMAAELGIERDAVMAVIDKATVTIVNDDRVVKRSALDQLRTDCVRLLEAHHEQHPYAGGLDLGRIESALTGDPDLDVVRFVVKSLVEAGRVARFGEAFGIAGFDPFAKLGASEKCAIDELERAFRGAGIEFLVAESVVGKDKTRSDVYRLLLESGRLVRLKTYDKRSNFVLHADVLDGVARALREAYPHPTTFALKDIRDLLGSTRKYVVPIMEHMDSTGMTVRSGDTRRLKE